MKIFFILFLLLTSCVEIEEHPKKLMTTGGMAVGTAESGSIVIGNKFIIILDSATRENITTNSN